MTAPLAVLPATGRARAFAAILSGLLFALAFPNASVVVLLPVALVPLIAAMEGVRPRRGALYGWLFGLAFWIVTVPWIGYTVGRYGGVSRPLAALSVVLVALILAPASAAMTALVAALRPRGVLAALLVWPAAWVVQEGVRTYLFGGFPWALAAYPLADAPALAQSAAFGGVALTSFLVVAVNAALHGAIAAPARRTRMALLAAALGAIGVAAALGTIRVRRLEAATPSPRRLRIGVVQPGVEQEVRWSAEARETIYRDLLAQTRALVRTATPTPDVVLWPESASPYHWSFSERYRTDLTALCRELGVSLLVSTVWSDAPEDDEAPYYNAALLLTQGGAELPIYKKQRLVPFGEYVPFGSLLRRIKPISRAVPGAFTPGTEMVLISVGGWKLGGAVCYEVIYPWIARAETRAGADVLFTLTNDSWYGTLGAKRQHWQGAVFRAIETERPLVRAAVTGISGWVGASGRARTIRSDRPGAFVVELGEHGAPIPPGVRLGEALLVVCAAGCAVGILRGLRPTPARPGARRPGEEDPT